VYSPCEAFAWSKLLPSYLNSEMAFVHFRLKQDNMSRLNHHEERVH
jgi:hypothetical protein